ncbi:hypothetical protein KIPB_002022, partial [Kipferlia bialata]|eukprot:g2022.t1
MGDGEAGSTTPVPEPRVKGEAGGVEGGHPGQGSVPGPTVSVQIGTRLSVTETLGTDTTTAFSIGPDTDLIPGLCSPAVAHASKAEAKVETAETVAAGTKPEGEAVPDPWEFTTPSPPPTPSPPRVTVKAEVKKTIPKKSKAPSKAKKGAAASAKGADTKGKGEAVGKTPKVKAVKTPRAASAKAKAKKASAKATAGSSSFMNRFLTPVTKAKARPGLTSKASPSPLVLGQASPSAASASASATKGPPSIPAVPRASPTLLRDPLAGIGTEDISVIDVADTVHLYEAKDGPV